MNLATPRYQFVRVHRSWADIAPTQACSFVGLGICSCILENGALCGFWMEVTFQLCALWICKRKNGFAWNFAAPRTVYKRVKGVMHGKRKMESFSEDPRRIKSV